VRRIKAFFWKLNARLAVFTTTLIHSVFLAFFFLLLLAFGLENISTRVRHETHGNVLTPNLVDLFPRQGESVTNLFDLLVFEHSIRKLLSLFRLILIVWHRAVERVPHFLFFLSGFLICLRVYIRLFVLKEVSELHLFSFTLLVHEGWPEGLWVQSLSCGLNRHGTVCSAGFKSYSGICAIRCGSSYVHWSKAPSLYHKSIPSYFLSANLVLYLCLLEAFYSLVNLARLNHFWLERSLVNLMFYVVRKVCFFLGETWAFFSNQNRGLSFLKVPIKDQQLLVVHYGLHNRVLSQVPNRGHIRFFLLVGTLRRSLLKWSIWNPLYRWRLKTKSLNRRRTVHVGCWVL